MGHFMITLEQTGIMFLMMTVGYVLFKGKLLSREGTLQLGALLINAVLPCAILNSFVSASEIPNATVLLAFGLCLLAVLLSTLISRLLFKADGIANFAASFSNAGFMGIPLIQALLGTRAVVYAAPFIAILNVLQATYGMWLITGSRKMVSPKKLMLNPILLSLVVSLAVYLTRLPVPAVIGKTISGIAAMNAPLAMFILGAYLAQSDILGLFVEKKLYMVSLVRLLIVPAATLLVFRLIPGVSRELLLSIIVAACAPVGSNVAIYAQRGGGDYAYACKTVCLSTLFSILTMPLVIMLAEKLF